MYGHAFLERINKIEEKTPPKQNIVACIRAVKSFSHNDYYVRGYKKRFMDIIFLTLDRSRLIKPIFF